MGKDESWIVEALAVQLEKFSDEPRKMLSQETIILTPYRSLFQNNSISLKKLSKSQLSQRRRVKDFLSDILKVVGQEPCVLCMLAGSITKWTMVDHTRAISVIQVWWRTALCPAGLSSFAQGVCEEYGISAPISPPSQKRARDIRDDGDIGRRTAGSLVEPLNEPPGSQGGDECSTSLHLRELRLILFQPV